MEPQIYTIGKIKMVKQAFIVLVSGIIGVGLLFLISLFAFSNIKVKAISGAISVLMFGLICYESYIINCTVVGNCNKVAWLLSILSIIVFIGYIFQIYSTFKMVDNIVTERKQYLSKHTSKKSSKSKK
jgi:hypothetical protein